MAKAKEYSASKTSSCSNQNCPSPVEASRRTVDDLSPNEQFNEGLWAAARDGNEECVRRCLDDWDADVNWVKDLPTGEPDGESYGREGRPFLKEAVLTYGGWKMASRALHVAVVYAADETGDRKQKEQATAARVVELLLSRQADVNACAERIYFDESEGAQMCQRVQAIHMASRVGNATVIETLLQHGADKDAEAYLEPIADTGSTQVLSTPIHDAVLDGNVDCVKLFLHRKVDVNVQNIDGNTPLHLAANRGYVSIVELLLGLKGARTAFQEALDKCTEKASGQRKRSGNLLDAVRLAVKAPQIPLMFCREKFDLLWCQNDWGRTALELAIRGGQFPAEDIYWFTTCYLSSEFKTTQDRHDFVDVFAALIARFPEVGTDLLRITDELEVDKTLGNVHCVHPINLFRLRQTLLCSEDSMKGKVLHKFLTLSENYPQTAAVMLQALTVTPMERDPLVDPLPRRFVPPRDDLYPLRCAYEQDKRWDLDPSGGVLEWHKQLGGNPSGFEACGTRGAFFDMHEVNTAIWVPATIPASVRVVHLQGFACPRFLSNLARQTEGCLFTKLAVQALLKFTWNSMRYLFILDMVYESAAILVISRWIVTSPNSAIFASQFLSDFMGRVAWCILAGQGSLEAIILLWTGIKHEIYLSHRDTMRWAQRNIHRICLSLITIGLACASQEEHWPSDDAVLSAVLGVTSFGHWLTMLYKVRAFVSTGTRLLPIMMAVLPIRGMLVILGFLMVGFLHVFWAMDRSHADEVSTWKFLTFLFIADNFINDEHLEGVSQEQQYLLMVFGGIGLFIFTSCSLNLFIAVLGEVYEQEQERMIVTFLKERACICSFLMLRPAIPMPKCSRWKCWLGLFALGAGTFVVVGCCMLLQISSWPGALMFAFLAVLQQALMKHETTEGWEKKYIWYVSNPNGAEEIFSLGHAEQDKMLPQNRAWKLKRYITEITSQLQKQEERHEERLAKARETQKAELKRVEEALNAKLRQALDAIKSLGDQIRELSPASAAHVQLSKPRAEEAASVGHLEETGALQAEVEVSTAPHAERPGTSAGGRRKRGAKGTQRGPRGLGSVELLATDVAEGS